MPLGLLWCEKYEKIHKNITVWVKIYAFSIKKTQTGRCGCPRWVGSEKDRNEGRSRRRLTERGLWIAGRGSSLLFPKPSKSSIIKH